MMLFLLQSSVYLSSFVNILNVWQRQLHHKYKETVLEVQRSRACLSAEPSSCSGVWMLEESLVVLFHTYERLVVVVVL